MGAATIDIAGMEAVLGHRFANPKLLETAVTHASLFEGRTVEASDYERLEFLGDRVLGLAVAEMLYLTFPDEQEGALARRHTALVRQETLARLAVELGLDAWMILSPSEEEGGGRESPAILSDVCEAVLGALYLDGGMEPARAFVVKHWTPLMGQDLTPPKDAKTTLQELVQAKGQSLPSYKVVKREGPDHAPVFTVRVMINGAEPAFAEATSRKAAEQLAAQALLDKLQP